MISVAAEALVSRKLKKVVLKLGEVMGWRERWLAEEHG